MKKKGRLDCLRVIVLIVKFKKNVFWLTGTLELVESQNEVAT